MINKVKKAIRTRLGRYRRQQFVKYYETMELDENAVLLEARNGKEIDGNIYYIARELLANPAYSHLKIYVTAESKTQQTIDKKIPNIISDINCRNGESADSSAGSPTASGPADPSRICTVLIGSTDYYKTIASCKYIACDATLKNFFIKREGQVYLNVWHGTPFKVMGRKVAGEPHMVGNAQKNFTIADYLLYPNDYMMGHMIEDYMIANTSKATIIMGGYPRNTAFFDKAKAAEIRKTQSIEDKRVFVYMPTYRHSLSGQALKDVLAEMDKNLKDDEIMFAKVHPLAADKVDYSDYSKIRKFPTEYETYEFLNTADCLITDYSSVFYDFAVTGKKIVLYTYDEEEYLETRGLYEPMSTLPFPQVKTVEETLAEARTEKNYDDSEFINKYCSYESPQATEVLCDIFINGPAGGPDGLEGSDQDNEQASDTAGETLHQRIELRQMPANGKLNAMVYTDNLKPGKKTDQLLEFLAEADQEQYNWFLSFQKDAVEPDKEMLFKLPEGIDYFGKAGRPYEISDKEKFTRIDNLRCYGNMSIDKYIYWDNK